MLIIDIFKLGYEHTKFFIGENFFLVKKFFKIFTKIIFLFSKNHNYKIGFILLI